MHTSLLVNGVSIPLPAKCDVKGDFLKRLHEPDEIGWHASRLLHTNSHTKMLSTGTEARSFHTTPTLEISPFNGYIDKSLVLMQKSALVGETELVPAKRRPSCVRQPYSSYCEEETACD